MDRTTDPDLTLRLLDQTQLRAAFLGAWDHLDHRATVRPCPRPMAMSGGQDGTLCVAAAWHAHRLVGVWPVVRTTRGTERVLVRAGGAAQVYDGPTLDPTLPEELLVRALWHVLRTEAGVDHILLTAIPTGSPVLTFGPVGAAARSIGTTTRVRPSTASSTDPGGDGVSVHRLTFPALREESLRHAIAWRTRGGHPSTADEQLLSLAAHPGLFEVFEVQVDAVPAAVLVGMVDSGSFTVTHTLVDPELADCGTEGLLLLEVASWVGGQGIAALDLAGPLPADTPWLGAPRTLSVWSATLSTAPGQPLLPSFRSATADRLLERTSRTGHPRTLRTGLRHVA